MGRVCVINPDPLAVRASRGLVHVDPMVQGVLAATCRLPLDAPMRATDLPDLIGRLMFE